ncbi:hypothetical protein H7J93_17010 [Mycobacterium barrassiae]|uniref:hypothetical protein n=1 Tax=Mycobacterium barrassiae TaxID=319709 RepID=UPI002265DAA6|nr:hypothetical protein [Mycobacterium barrassiae]MCV7301322.1 hypothetical protein [Mycobacterium barrassiae]
MPNRKRSRIQAGQKREKPPEPYKISVPMFNGMPSTDARFNLSKFNTPATDRVVFNLTFQAPRFR